MKHIKLFEEFEALDSIKRFIGVPPEEDILRTISLIENWFKSHPDKDSYKIFMFGNPCVINRNSIEKDIRDCAKNAKSYKKIKSMYAPKLL